MAILCEISPENRGIMQHGLEVSWDAANAISAWLAKKLGYTPWDPYEMWVRIG